MIERTPNNTPKKVSAAGGAHFCCTDQQPIFNCDVAELHGNSATVWLQQIAMLRRVRILFATAFCLVITKLKKLPAMPMPAHIYILANAVEDNKNANCCKTEQGEEGVKTDVH